MEAIRAIMKVASVTLVLGVLVLRMNSLSLVDAQCCNQSPILAACQPRPVSMCVTFKGNKPFCLDSATVETDFQVGTFACCSTPGSKTNCVPVAENGIAALTLCSTLYKCKYDDLTGVCSRDVNTKDQLFYPVFMSAPCP